MAWKLIHDYASQGGGSSKKVRTYREGFVVTGTGAGATALAVRQFIGVIPYVTVWASDPGAVCVSTSEEQIESNVWRSDCKYSTVQEDPRDNAEDPLRRPPKRSSSAVEVETFPDRDLDGKLIINSASQRYEDVSIPESHKILTIRRNEATHDFLGVSKWENKTNKGKFYGAQAGRALSKAIVATEEYENEIHFAAVTYAFHFAPDGETWISRKIDAGRWYYKVRVDPDTGLKKRVRLLPEDDDDCKFSDVVPLDGKGGLLNERDALLGNFKYKEFRRFQSINFGPLNLEW